jgi:hypothetical protein
MTMSDSISWDFNAAQARFTAELQRVIASSRRGMRHEVTENFKGALRFCFAVTPPMGGRTSSVTSGRNIRVDYAHGKRQGQRAIRKDISRAFQPIKAAFKQTALRPGGWARIQQLFGPRATQQALDKTPEAVLSWYKAKRGRNRRIMGRPRLPTWTTNIQFVEKTLLKEQGLTASGWLAGANRFNVRGIPQWITRHGGKVGGSVTIRDTATELKYLVTNATQHNDSMRIQGKLATALTLQANAMARRMAANINRERIT